MCLVHRWFSSLGSHCLFAPFVSSTGNFNIIALERMKKLNNNAFVGNNGHFENEILTWLAQRAWTLGLSSPLATVYRRSSMRKWRICTFPSSLETRVDGPCQGTGESLGFREELWSCEEESRFAAADFLFL